MTHSSSSANGRLCSVPFDLLQSIFSLEELFTSLSLSPRSPPRRNEILAGFSFRVARGSLSTSSTIEVTLNSDSSTVKEVSFLVGSFVILRAVMGTPMRVRCSSPSNQTVAFTT
eukprot:Mycagemm_TRINITY_DN9454_c0_g1::TRINITY_DN9454_c0_g1_i1::g.3123::m.3123 type:complete len:114 gc:universal TRINITY_DN9454_c0_g1_i1:97-438(+)